MLHEPRIFEHPEVFDSNDIPNRPVRPFYPSAQVKDQKLTPAQLGGVHWMESRVEKGGGFIGDECGMGKVHLCPRKRARADGLDPASINLVGIEKSTDEIARIFRLGHRVSDFCRHV